MKVAFSPLFSHCLFIGNTVFVTVVRLLSPTSIFLVVKSILNKNNAESNHLSLSPFRHLLQHRRQLGKGRGPLPVCGFTPGWKNRTSDIHWSPAHHPRYSSLRVGCWPGSCHPIWRFKGQGAGHRAGLFDYGCWQLYEESCWCSRWWDGLVLKPSWTGEESPRRTCGCWQRETQRKRGACNTNNLQEQNAKPEKRV